MLISPSYIEQNAMLHTQRADYGAAGGRHGKKIASLMKEFGCATLLDYGCGKGSLLKEIPGAVGYDPAVPGFSSRPHPADLVSCTDVLEHIEPECLDEVLEDLRMLSKRLAFLVISCRAAYKTLPDGRNAHLIVQPHEWWLQKAQEHFGSLGWVTTKDELIFLGTPLAEKTPFTQPIKPVFSEHGTPAFTKLHRLFISPADSIVNIRSSCARGLPNAEIQDPHDRRMALCAYGPSLKDYIKEIGFEKGDVVTVSGAHDVLRTAGLTPFMHIEADAHEHKAQLTSLAGPGTHYYLASRCHPAVFDNITAKAARVSIWHLAHADEENAEVMKVYPETVFVQGSVSVAGRAMCLGMVLGYRHFTIYGMDCSFPWDESLPFDQQLQHAGKHPNPQDVFRTDPINGRAYYSTLQLISTAEQFLKVASRATLCTFDIRGEGMLAAKAKLLGCPRIHAPDLKD